MSELGHTTLWHSLRSWLRFSLKMCFTKVFHFPMSHNQAKYIKISVRSWIFRFQKNWKKVIFCYIITDNSAKNADFREKNCPPFFFVKLQNSISTLITNIFQNFFRLNRWEGRNLSFGRFHKIMELKISELSNNMSKRSFSPPKK